MICLSIPIPVLNKRDSDWFGSTVIKSPLPDSLNPSWHEQQMQLQLLVENGLGSLIFMSFLISQVPLISAVYPSDS